LFFFDFAFFTGKISGYTFKRNETQNPVTIPSIIIMGILAVIMARLVSKKFSSVNHNAAPKSNDENMMEKKPAKNPAANVNDDLPSNGEKI
jgi:hypothetical protein